jgi:hypothetical protein
MCLLHSRRLLLHLLLHQVQLLLLLQACLLVLCAACLLLWCWQHLLLELVGLKHVLLQLGRAFGGPACDLASSTDEELSCCCLSPPANTEPLAPAVPRAVSCLLLCMRAQACACSPGPSCTSWQFACIRCHRGLDWIYRV